MQFRCAGSSSRPEVEHRSTYASGRGFFAAYTFPHLRMEAYLRTDIDQLNDEALREKLATKVPLPLDLEAGGKLFEMRRKASASVAPRGNLRAKGSSSRQITGSDFPQILESREIGLAAAHEAPRTNQTLSYSQAVAVDNASKQSIEIGRPLNCFVTVNWNAAGVPDPVRATGQYLKLVSDALRKRGHATAYLWVQECGPVIGQHVHILLHLPPAFTHWFKRRQPGWLRSCGVASRKGHARSKSIGETYQQCLGDALKRESYRRELRHLLSYLLKDAEPKARAVLGIRHVGGFGAVRGKRASVSQNLRRSAD